jgi:putative transposase
MFKNRRLARKAGEQMFYKIKTIITNKFNQHDKKTYQVDKFFPSTQMCSNCGNVKKGKDKMVLKNRTYICKKCGFKMNRDENAAINIYQCKEKEIIELHK